MSTYSVLFDTITDGDNFRCNVAVRVSRQGTLLDVS